MSLTVPCLYRLKFERGYEEFRTNLEHSLSGDSTSLLSRGEGITAALEVLRGWGEGEGDDDSEGDGGDEGDNEDEGHDEDDGEDQEEDHDEMDDDISASAADRDETTDDKTSQQKTPVRKMDVVSALEILVHNAIKEFGFAPRDVYKGVLNLPKAKRTRDFEVDKLNYPKLKAIIEAFTENRELHPLSNHVVAVYPRQSFPADDLWEINFKSPLIARRVVELMRSQEAKHLWESYELLHKTPEGSRMAGWFFKAIAHHTLSQVPTPRPSPMTSNRGRNGPPVFYTQDPPSRTPTPDASQSSAAPSRVTCHISPGRSRP